MKLASAVFLLMLAPLAANCQDGAKTIERINPPTLSAPHGYSHVVIARGGRTVYIAGQVALDKDGKLVGEGDFGAQAKQVFENLKAALAAAHLGFADVVSITIYVTDLSQIDKFREFRNQYFGSDLPASTLIEVKGLFRPDVMIEMNAIAVARK